MTGFGSSRAPVMGAWGSESLLVFPGPNRRKRFYAWAERFIEVLRCCINCT